MYQDLSSLYPRWKTSVSERQQLKSIQYLDFMLPDVLLSKQNYLIFHLEDNKKFNRNYYCL